jgi:hypothetical protein
MATASCPFCGSEVPAELVAEGGTCPKCLAEIPGDDAPTDPGQEVRKEQEQSDRIRARIPIVVAFGLLFLLVSVTGVVAIGVVLWPEPEVAELLDFDAIDFPMPEVASAADLAPPPVADAPPPAPGKSPKPGPREFKGPNIQVPDLASSGGAPIPEGGSVSGGEMDGPRRVRVGAAAGPAIGPSGPSGPTTVGGGVVTIGGPKVRRDDGRTLEDAEEIRMMIGERMREYIPGLQYCYERRLKVKENLAGRWSLTFTVMPTGAAENIVVRGIETQDSELEGCVADIVAERWRFSKLKVQQPVKKTLTFKN